MRLVSGLAKNNNNNDGKKAHLPVFPLGVRLWCSLSYFECHLLYSFDLIMYGLFTYTYSLVCLVCVVIQGIFYFVLFIICFWPLVVRLFSILCVHRYSVSSFHERCYLRFITAGDETAIGVCCSLFVCIDIFPHSRRRGAFYLLNVGGILLSSPLSLALFVSWFCNGLLRQRL